MKKAIRISVSLLVVVMAFSSFCFGQDQQKVQKTKMIHFTNESVKTEVKLNLKETISYFEIKIECRLDQGQASIEIIDPNGKVKGKYSIKTESSISKGKNTKITERANGSIIKRFSNPSKGNWQVKLVPERATGNVIINLDEYYKSGADVHEFGSIIRVSTTENEKKK